MMEALGLKVVRLMRIAVGNLRLPSNLLPGKIRPVTEAEKEYLAEIKKNLYPEETPKKRATKPLLSEKELKQKKEVKKKTTATEYYVKKVTDRQKKVQTLSRERKKAPETKK